LVIAFVILPLLPNHYIDPWSLINPTKIWVLFVLISGVEFGAYIAGRALGGGSGIILVGLFGGLVSATTTTLNLAARTRKTHSPGRLVVSSIVLAEVASMLMQLITLHTIAPIASTKLSMILIAPCLLGLIIAVGLLTLRKNGSTRQAKTINLNLDNPLNSEANRDLCVGDFAIADCCHPDRAAVWHRWNLSNLGHRWGVQRARHHPGHRQRCQFGRHPD
jgi:uncharacterized membrane protein (DUF4010 family)